MVKGEAISMTTTMSSALSVVPASAATPVGDDQVADQQAVGHDDVDRLQHLERGFGVVDGQSQEHGRAEAGALVRHTGLRAHQQRSPDELDPVVGVLGQGQDVLDGPRPAVLGDCNSQARSRPPVPALLVPGGDFRRLPAYGSPGSSGLPEDDEEEENAEEEGGGQNSPHTVGVES
ncbi:hypothetical protein [Kitasatospora purpeofusca]|uniref:hypothetical protein n=1 Tax=Kitasatospora purpeofusca TaxID=67352 RepID=UPI003807EA03